MLWYIQGLNGGPRRYSVLPDSYEPLAIAGVPFTLLLAIGQLIFAWNLIRTLRGERRANDERPFLLDGRQVSLAATTLCVSALVPLLAVGLGKAPSSDQNVTPPTAEQPGGGANPPPSGPGKDLFVSNCGSCHTLAAAGTTGTVGPSLDSVFVDEDGVLQAIEIGGAGSGQMPAGLLEGEQAEQDAEYVAAATGSSSP